jgi:hypothetical protein
MPSFIQPIYGFGTQSENKLFSQQYSEWNFLVIFESPALNMF